MLRLSRVQQCAAATAATSASPVVDAVAAVLRSARYLRHAPPRMYVTCAHDRGLAADACGRHRTTVLDVSRAASPSAPPHTQSIYLLTSTSMADVAFADTAAQSQVLVGLPHIQSVDAVQRFCDAHATELARVHHIVLPGDVSPLQSLLIKQLLTALPSARLACSRFGHAMLTNGTFYDGVRRAVLENAPTTPLELLRFAELPADRVSAVADGDAVAVDVPSTSTSSAASPARALRVVAVKSKAQQQRRRELSQTHLPVHFHSDTLFFYDDVFHALHVGHTLLRPPWLPTVLHEASRELLLPLPPALATTHPLGRPSPLLDTWRVTEWCSDIVATLRRTPELERVLCGAYGEVSGDIEDCVAGLERSCDALEGLRSRLARRLATDTSRDVHRWSGALLRRVVEEVVCTQTASEPTPPALRDAFLAWARTDEAWGRLAASLTHAAMVLPPTTEAPEPAPAGGGAASPASSPAPLSASDSAAAASAALEGAAGVDLLVAIFNKKGLQGLTRVAQRETIDVRVFLAMTEEDLRTVFKATFGVAKRLKLLQEELRTNM